MKNLWLVLFAFLIFFSDGRSGIVPWAIAVGFDQKEKTAVFIDKDGERIATILWERIIGILYVPDEGIM